MKSYLRDRDVRYDVEYGYLVRTVTEGSGDGRSYCHRCSKTTYETLAHAVEETPVDGEGTTADLIARQEDLPFTQASVAMEFLKERGVVAVRYRRCYPATLDAYLDAMIEFHALTKKPPL